MAVTPVTVSLAETNSALQAGGTLVDTAGFVAQTNVDGTNGRFNIDSAGVWTYRANEKFDYLNVGQSVSDTFTVQIAGGTTTVQVTINGTNDAAVICGTSIGTVTEAGGVANATLGTPTVTATLTDTDLDNTANTFTPVATATASTGGFGSFTMTAGGVWTYTLNNANAAVQALRTSTQLLTDTFSVTAVDGTPRLVTVTIMRMAPRSRCRQRLMGAMIWQ